MSMLKTIRELLRYEAWADTQILASVEQHGVWSEDDVRARLNHALLVQNLYLSIVRGKKPDMEQLDKPFDTLDDFLASAARYRKKMRAFADGMTKKNLARKVRIPWFGKKKFPVLEVLSQVVLHSQHHRGQTALRLKQLGHTPPTFDYIVWNANGKPDLVK